MNSAEGNRTGADVYLLIALRDQRKRANGGDTTGSPKTVKDVGFEGANGEARGTSGRGARLGCSFALSHAASRVGRLATAARTDTLFLEGSRLGSA
jgi:hypothetical protein